MTAQHKDPLQEEYEILVNLRWKPEAIARKYPKLIPYIKWPYGSSRFEQAPALDPLRAGASIAEQQAYWRKVRLAEANGGRVIEEDDTPLYQAAHWG